MVTTAQIEQASGLLESLSPLELQWCLDPQSSLSPLEVAWCLGPCPGYLPPEDPSHWPGSIAPVKSFLLGSYECPDNPGKTKHLVGYPLFSDEDIEHYISRGVPISAALCAVQHIVLEPRTYDSHDQTTRGRRGFYDFPGLTTRTLNDYPEPPDIDFDLLLFTAPQRYSELARVLIHELQMRLKDEEKDFTNFPPRYLHFADLLPRMLNAARWRRIGGEKDRLPLTPNFMAPTPWLLNQQALKYPIGRHCVQRFYEIAGAGVDWDAAVRDGVDFQAIIRANRRIFFLKQGGIAYDCWEGLGTKEQEFLQTVLAVNNDWEAYADREERLIDGTPGLKRHESNPKFPNPDKWENWGINNSRISFAEKLPPVKPEFWEKPQVVIPRHILILEETGKPLVQPWKHMVSNLRCKVCGAVDGAKYPVQSRNLQDTSETRKCYVDAETQLCDRKICIRARGYKGEYNPQGLRTGYPGHSEYWPTDNKLKTPSELMRWARSDEPSSATDPNLDCSNRYMYPRSKRKTDVETQELRKHYANLTKTFGSDYVKEEYAARARVAEIAGTITLSPMGECLYSTKQNAEEQAWEEWGIEISDYLHEDILREKSILYNDAPELVLMVGIEPEQEHFTPNLNCFSADQNTESKTVVDEDGAEEKAFKPAWALDDVLDKLADEDEAIGLDEDKAWKKRYLLLLKTLRDPGAQVITAMEKVTWESKLRKAFEEWTFPEAFPEYARQPMKYYVNPDRLGKEVFTTVRQSTGSEDEIHQQQLDALAKIEREAALTKAQKEKARWVRDILDGARSDEDVAKEQGRTVKAVRDEMNAFLRTSVEDLKPERQWAIALQNNKKKLADGFYALVKLPNCAAKPYLLLSSDGVDVHDEASKIAFEHQLEKAIEDAVCDVLEQRIKNKRIDGDCPKCRHKADENYVCKACEIRLLALALELHQEFNRLPLMARVDGVWYDVSGKALITR